MKRVEPSVSISTSFVILTLPTFHDIRRVPMFLLCASLSFRGDAQASNPESRDRCVRVRVRDYVAPRNDERGRFAPKHAGFRHEAQWII
jgi:hypothetical protein